MNKTQQKTFAPNPTEAEMRETLRAAAKAGGWMMWFVHDSRHSPAGWPDMWFLRGGEALFMELKRTGKKWTPVQEKTIYALREFAEAHGIAHWMDAFVVTPGTLQAACEMLTASRRTP